MLEGHSREVGSVAFSLDGKAEPALPVTNDWVVEEGEKIVWFLLIIGRLVRLSGTKLLC